MPRRKKPGRVSEPVQVYLDKGDRELLERVARESDLSRAEVLRRALRSYSLSVLKERPPGWSFDLLIGALGDDPSLPTDLAERHDYYLNQAWKEKAERNRTD